MRINQWLALAAGISRRDADSAISEGRVTINGEPASLGSQVNEIDKVSLDGRELLAPVEHQTIMLNKPAGYVCSRDGQGSKTVYDLLPPDLQHLKPAGRLDKDSSGLLLMTTDGQLAYELTHPKFQKQKIYEISLNKPLAAADRQQIEAGVMLNDGPSKLILKPLNSSGTAWQVTMHEGRNRQIRRTFAVTGYKLSRLHRTEIGTIKLTALKIGKYNFL